MKQNSNPKMPIMGDTIKNNAGVTEKELIYQLLSKSSGARMLAKKKREFLTSICNLKSELLAKSLLMDSIVDSGLSNALGSLIHVNNRFMLRMKNEQLSQDVARFLPLLKLLREFILAQYKEEKERKGHNLRTSANEEVQKRTPLMVLLDEAQDGCLCYTHAFSLFSILTFALYSGIHFELVGSCVCFTRRNIHIYSFFSVTVKLLQYAALCHYEIECVYHSNNCGNDLTINSTIILLTSLITSECITPITVETI